VADSSVKRKKQRGAGKASYRAAVSLHAQVNAQGRFIWQEVGVLAM
jgi:hypothetical protein